MGSKTVDLRNIGFNNMNQYHDPDYPNQLDYTNYEETLRLWIGGWCWNQIGLKFGCSGETIKKYAAGKIKIEDRISHKINHIKKLCPCYKPKVVPGQLQIC